MYPTDSVSADVTLLGLLLLLKIIGAKYSLSVCVCVCIGWGLSEMFVVI